VVDLPIPDQPDVTAQAPTPRVSGFQYARSGSFLAAGLDRLSDGLEAVAVHAAKDQAVTDLQSGMVTRDAQGNITVGKPAGMPILGQAGIAYEQAIKAGALAQGDNLAQRDMADLAAQHQGDPQGLLQAGNAYVAGVRARNPGPIGEAMADRASSVLTQHYDGAVARQATVNVENARTAIADARTSAFNTLSSLAQQGVTTGPDWEKAQADYQAAGRQLVANPAFGVSQTLQDANDKADLNLLHGYAIAGNVDRDMKGPGGVDQARQNLFDAVHDPKLGLSPSQQAHFMAVGESRIGFVIGQYKADAAANRANLEALTQAAHNPEASAKLTEPVWQAAILKSAAIPGAEDDTKRLLAEHQVWQLQNATRTDSPNQSLVRQGLGPEGAIDASGAASRVGGTTAGFYLSALARGDVQGALRASEGLRTTPYPDVNHLRTGYGSDTVTRADGTVEEVGPDTRITPADAERDLQRRTGIYAQGAAQAIGPAWASMTPGAQAAITSMAYNYGHVPQNVAAAAATGDPAAIAAAIRAHAGDNNGANYARRQAEARAVLGEGTGMSANGTPFTPEQVRQNPFLLSTYVQSITLDPENRYNYAATMIEGATKSVGAGIMPSVDTLASIAQIAQTDPRLAEKAAQLQAAVTARALSDQAINLPPGQGQAYIDMIKDRAQGGSLYQAQVAEQARTFYDKGVEQLKKDPWGTAVAKGWDGGEGAPIGLNFDDQNALAVGLHQRSDLASSIAARTGDNTAPALAPDELPQARGILTSGSLQQRVNLANAIGTLPEDRREATFRALGAGGVEGMAMAAAASLMPTAPDVAQSVMRGQGLLREDAKRWAPEGELGGKSQFQQNLDAALPPTMFSIQDRANPAGAYETIRAMARARYADLAAQSGQSGYSPDRVRQSVADVTGGVVTHNGSSIIAPQRGMDQRGFDRTIAGVTDPMLAGVTSPNGEPVTADYLRNNAQLESIGSGRYFVRLGSDPARPVYAYQGADSEAPTKFVLDLRRVQPAASSGSNTWDNYNYQ